MIALCPALIWQSLALLKATNILIVNNSAGHFADCLQIRKAAGTLWDLGNWGIINIHFPIKSKMAESGSSAKITSVVVPHSYYRSSRFKMEQVMWNLKGCLTHRWMSYVVPKFDLVRSTTLWVSAGRYWKKCKKKMKNSEYKLGKSPVSGRLPDFAHIWCTVWACDSRCAKNVGGQEVKGEVTEWRNDGEN